MGFAAYIKPVDSSGSKGVTRVDDSSDLDAAFAHALKYSREKLIVIEQEIERTSNQVAGRRVCGKRAVGFSLLG